MQEGNRRELGGRREGDYISLHTRSLAGLSTAYRDLPYPELEEALGCPPASGSLAQTWARARIRFVVFSAIFMFQQFKSARSTFFEIVEIRAWDYGRYSKVQSGQESASKNIRHGRLSQYLV